MVQEVITVKEVVVCVAFLDVPVIRELGQGNRISLSPPPLPPLPPHPLPFPSWRRGRRHDVLVFIII